MQRFTVTAIKLFLLLAFFNSFEPMLYSRNIAGFGLSGSSESIICSTQSGDTLQKMVRFDHSDGGFDYYVVNFSMFHSDFERLDFYGKARNRDIYIADKGDFHKDAPLFIAPADKEKVWSDFEELVQSAMEAGATTPAVVQQEFVSSSPFFKPGFQTGLPDAPATGLACTDASVACSGNTYTFPSGTTGTAPPAVGGYPNYGCLGSTPCPAWFYMQVSAPGSIIITISQSGNNDVDFICWGPFTSLSDGCATGLTGTCQGSPVYTCCSNTSTGCVYPQGNMVDCSYSTSATETCHILNAQVGQIYILLITNFSQMAGTITFSQTGGTGITNCNNVVHCSMINITHNTTACNGTTNSYSVSGNMEFSNPPTTGTLTITDITAVPPVSQTFTHPFVSPLAYNLANIPCTGTTHYLNAVFSDSTACSLTQQYAAPSGACLNGVVSGGGSICNNGTSQVTVIITITGASGPYNFTYAINGVNQPPVVNYSGSLPYQINTQTPGTYTLVALSSPSCTLGAFMSGSAVVILNPLPVPGITGSNTACQGSVNNIYSTESGMTSYVWTVSAGGSITSGAGTNSIHVNWNAIGAQNLTVRYTNGNGCAALNPTVFNVTVSQMSPPTITGLSTMCINSGNYTYITEAGMANYVWTVSPGGTIVSGAATNQLTVTWGAGGAQWVKVNYTTSNGCTAGNPTQFNVTVNPLPSPAGVITGVASVCAGSQGIAYSVALVPDATSYAWTLPSGATILTGAGTNSIGVSFSASAISGDITVTGNNVCGNGSSSPPFPVTVVPIPAAPGIVSGPTKICTPENGVNYKVNPVAGATGYAWSLPPGAIVMWGATTDSIILNFPITATSGHVSVATTNTCGSSAPSPNLAVTVTITPATTSIYKQHDTLFSNVWIGNQWFRNDSLIAGADTFFYVPYQSGDYFARISDKNCFSDSSNHIRILMTGIESIEGSGFTISPVPNDGRFLLSITSVKSEILDMVIINNLGQTVFEMDGLAVSGTVERHIDLRPVSPGVYTVILKNRDYKMVKKIIVCK